MPEWIKNYWLEWIFGTFAAALTGALKLIWNKQKAQTSRQMAIEDGLKGLLHDRIYQLHTSCLEKGYASIADLENLEYIYPPYKALDGNGTGTHMYESIKSMPNKPADK